MARDPTPRGNTVVTGAAGFAGSHLVDRLIRLEPVVGWHRPGSPARDVGERVRWVPVDLLDRARVRQALAELRPSRVFHIAGAARADTSWTNVVPHLETNVLGTHYLLDSIRELSLPCRVLVVSSGMLYHIDAGPLAEDAPLVPSSPYGMSKLAQDQLALQAAVDDGLDVVVARPFNHMGPRQAQHFAVGSFARQIALIEAGRADPVIRVGNLDAARDLTDVRDVADAYEQLMERGLRGRAYNVCSGTAVPIRQVLDELLSLSTTTVRVDIDPERLRPSDIPVLLGDPARIRREVGWRPSFALRDTLRDTLDWWRSQTRPD